MISSLFRGAIFKSPNQNINGPSDDTIIPDDDYLAVKISYLVALSEERLAQLQELHFKIDEIANNSIERLSYEIEKVKAARQSCHEQLEAMMGKQTRDIQTCVVTLEARLVLSAECAETEGAAIVDVTHTPCDLQDRRKELKAIAAVEKQSQIILRCEAQLCNFSIPHLLEATAHINSVPMLATPGNHPEDVEILSMSDKHCSFFVLGKYGLESKLDMFNGVTGNLDKTFGEWCAQATIISKPVPLLLVSSYLRCHIIVYNAVTGAQLRTIGGPGSGLVSHYTPSYLCARQFDNGNQHALLYVACTDSNRVQVIDVETGAGIRSINTAINAMESYRRPGCLATFEGNDAMNYPVLFVSESHHAQLKLYHADSGAFVKTIQCKRSVSGLAVCAVDNVSDPLLIVTSQCYHTIDLYNAVTGVLVKTVSSHGSAVGQVDSPRGVRVFSVDNDKIVIYVADRDNNRVQQISFAP